MAKFTDCLTSADSGTPVGINYRGQSSYTTCPGALLSMLLYVSIIAYGIYSTLLLMDNSNIRVN